MASCAEFILQYKYNIVWFLLVYLVCLRRKIEVCRLLYEGIKRILVHMVSILFKKVIFDLSSQTFTTLSIQP